MDSREEVRVDQPPRRTARLPRPRRRRTETPTPGGLAALLKTVRSYNPKADVRQLEQAYRVAEAAHEGQVRLSGEPFIEHPVAVTQILADLRLDTTTLTAALLHDTVEDTTITTEGLAEEFGEDVARIVDGLTKLDRLQFKTRELAQAENVRKMIVAMAGDIRVLLIKLADRLHNMRTLGALPIHKQHRIATETLEIYAPLANRLGVQEVKWELEDLAFKTLHPGPYKEIAQLVETRREERTRTIAELTSTLRQKLKELGIKADVDGRPKHLYSIYEKMVIRGKEFEEIHDLVGIRVSRSSRCATATRRSAPSTRPGSRSPAASRTTSRCPSRTCTSRCTPPWWGRPGARSRSRSGRATCTAPRSSGSRRTGATRRAASRRTATSRGSAR